MHTDRLRTLVLFPALAATVLAGCDGGTHGEAASVSPSLPVPSPLMSPVPADDDAAYYGIGLGDVHSDRYGDYRGLGVDDPLASFEWEEVDLQASVAEKYLGAQLDAGLIHSARFVVAVVLDSPLVFDDSAAAAEQFWGLADVYLPTGHTLRATLDERTEPESWALVDDDRGEWRQAAGYGPAPYREGEARTKVQEIRLARVFDDDDALPGELRYKYSFIYDRPIVFADGREATEHTEGTYTVSIDVTDPASTEVTGLSWGTHVFPGDYIDGGIWGWDVLATPGEPYQNMVDDGLGLELPVPQMWSTRDDLDEAISRGIRPVTVDDPEATFAYFEELGDSDNKDYVALKTWCEGRDPHESAADSARRDAGDDDDDAFWPDGGAGGRLELAGADHASVQLWPAQPGDRRDVVTVEVIDGGDCTHAAYYWVAAGTGSEVLDLVARHVRFVQ